MERTTIYLDEVLKRRLKDTAAVRGVTEASLLREALARYLDGEKRPSLRPVGRSHDGGVARRTDDALRKRGFGRK